MKTKKNLDGEIIPVGSNRNYSVNDVIEIVEKCWNKKIEREYIKMRLGETPTEILLDNKKLKNILDYEIKWDLTKGLIETIPYYEQAFKDSS